MFRRIIRPVGIWVLVFAFTAQSTGAASMGAMMGPGVMRFPPAHQGLPPVILMPSAPSNVQGPSSLTAAGSWVQDKLNLTVYLAREINSEFWSFLSGADELLAPLEPVNLDLPAPRVPAVSVAVLPVKTESPVVRREISPVPKWTETVLPRVERPQLPTPAKPVEIKPVNDKKNLRRFPRLNAARSNWFKPFALTNIWREEGGPRRIGTLARMTRPARVLPRLDGQWQRGEGIEFRVNYLNPVGISRADEHGLLYNELGRFMQNPGEVLPRAYWGSYAIYRHGQTVDCEIEIRNSGKKTIKDMDVIARQEVLSLAGGPGEALPGGIGRFRVPSLAPGGSVKLKNSFKVTGDWRFHGSFEQTHLRVTGVAEKRGKPKLLAQAYQAGIIDPPPDD